MTPDVGPTAANSDTQPAQSNDALSKDIHPGGDKNRTKTRWSDSLLTPQGMIEAAKKAHPAFRYAIAVAGIAALVAIVIKFGVSPPVLVFGVIIALFFMFVFLIFAIAVRARNRKQYGSVALVVLWALATLFIAILCLLLTSSFFDVPIKIRSYLENRIHVQRQTQVKSNSDDDAGRPSLNAAALREIDIGMPRRKLEGMVGAPVSEQKLKEIGNASIAAAYCRYSAWQKQAPPNGQGKRKRYGAGLADDPLARERGEYPIADLRVYYDDNDSVACFIVEVNPNVIKYEFPGGTLGKTTFGSFKGPQVGFFGPDKAINAELFDPNARDMAYVEQHYLKRDRYYWLSGNPVFNVSDDVVYAPVEGLLDDEDKAKSTNDGDGDKSETPNARTQLVDRDQTVIERVLVYGLDYNVKGTESLLEDAVHVAGWAWDNPPY